MKKGNFVIGFVCGIGVWIAAFLAALTIGGMFLNSDTAIPVCLVLILLIIAGFLYRKIGESSTYSGMLVSVAIAIVLSTACGITFLNIRW